MIDLRYYDKYNSEWSVNFDNTNKSVFNDQDNKIIPQQSTLVKGQITGTKTKILGTTEWITTTNYYDDHYRVIQTIVDNPYQNVIETFTTQYDFSGQVRHTHLQHILDPDSDPSTLNSITWVIQKMFEYDHMGRLLKVYHKIGEDPKYNWIIIYFILPHMILIMMGYWTC